MQHWTKNGSIPTTLPDSTAGWQHAPEPPTDIPEGKNLVWLNWEWIIRDPKPEDRPGYQWNWNHADRAWVESAWPQAVIEENLVIEQILATDQIASVTTDQIGTLA
jgi:hypothetical protein